MDVDPRIRKLLCDSWFDRLLKKLFYWTEYGRLARQFDSETDELRRAFQKVYHCLSEAEVLYPRQIDRNRRKEIATSLELSPLMVAGAVTLLVHHRVNFQLTLDAAITLGRRAFSKRVVRVLKASAVLAQSLGDEFVDSAHWLISLYEVGSPLIRDCFLKVGLNHSLMLASRVALEGRCADLGGNRTGLCLAEDAVRVLAYLIENRDSENRDLLNEKAFAVGLMRAGRSKAAAIVKDNNIAVPTFIASME